nr:MAG TPA: holin [Bacteriophage sp.]
MHIEVKIVLAPLVMMCLDVMFGYVGAIRNGTLNSTVMRDGLWNKTLEMLIIAAGFGAQFCISVFGKAQLGFEVYIPVSTGICAYICVYELTSIIENIGKFSPRIGEKFIEILGIDPEKVGLIRVDDSSNSFDSGAGGGSDGNSTGPSGKQAR